MCTHKRTRNMLEPDQWDSVLSTIVGTVYRGAERVASSAIIDALGVPKDQQFGKR
jgi:hypothetical protein